MSQGPEVLERQEGASALCAGSIGACTFQGAPRFPTTVNLSRFPGPHASGTPCASSARMPLIGAIGQIPFPRRLREDVRDDTGGNPGSPLSLLV